MPTTPQKAAGCRIDPPVSEPRAAGHILDETAAADPPELPPGTRFKSKGFFTGPKYDVSLDEPPEGYLIPHFPSQRK